jgi:hypothetical protein
MRILRVSVLALVLTAMVLVAQGCTPPPLTQQQLCELSQASGSGAALLYVATKKPPAAQVTVVKFVVDQVKAAAVSYPAGGWSTLTPQIAVAIDKALPNNPAGVKLANEVAGVVLVGLDLLFDAHPDWKQQGAVASAYASAFCDGASSALAKYITSP